MTRSLIRVFTVLLLSILTACGDGVEPLLDLTEFELCSKPNWIAVRNSSDWDFIDVPEPEIPFGPVRVPVRVSSPTSVAIGYSSSVQIYQVLREELGELRCQFRFPGPFRAMNGNVTGIPDGALFQVAYGPYTGLRSGPGTFSMGAEDSVATIIAKQTPLGFQRPAGILLVRGFGSSGQSEFPPLDFSSPDTRVLDSAQLNISGAGGTVFRSHSLRTGGTTMSLVATASLPAYYYALSGPSHPDDIYSASFSSTAKTVTWYYGGLSGDASVAFGPDLPTIEARNIADASCRRFAANFPVQTELASGARITFTFASHPRFGTSVSIVVSAGFKGADDRWEVEIPALPGACTITMQTNLTSITATAYGGNFRVHLGASPVAGDQIRTVSASRPAP